MTTPAGNEWTALWDWRRQVADLYGAIRRKDDPRAAWQQWRDTRDRLFRHHSQTPLDAEAQAQFHAGAYYPYDPALRFRVGLSAPADTLIQQFPEGPDGTIAIRPFARTSGLADALGGELTCYWITGYGGGVFLPFADATNGSETFAAGRYLLDSIKGADLGMIGTDVVLDFNFSYFPSCAYSPRWVCPLAPPQNRLPAPVRGGERL